MPRTTRLIINDETAVYHVMSRTALDGFPLGDIEKDFMLNLIRRYEAFYGDERTFAAGWIPSLREKLSNLSEFVREIKVGFTRYYNKRHNRRGYFWGDRFKSVIVEKERKRKFELSRSDRFRYRTRYFTDSGVIGSKEFVSENYQRFKAVFMSKREKIPRRVVGLDGVFSLKRLEE